MKCNTVENTIAQIRPFHPPAAACRLNVRAPSHSLPCAVPTNCILGETYPYAVGRTDLDNFRCFTATVLGTTTDALTPSLKIS